MTAYTYVESPIGPLLLVSNGRALTKLYMNAPVPPDGAREDATAEPLPTVAAQLAEYFRGERTSFDFPMEAEGTEFQKLVWKELCEIPYGATISYGELARRIGNPAASRAVGAANGQNPISIVVPCHRVIGANGKLTGYGGGLPNKERLLELERGTPALFA